MFDAFLQKLASFGNRRAEHLSVPVFDGACKPNNLLEEAAVLVDLADLEDLAVSPTGRLFAACGPQVLEIHPDGQTSVIATFPQPVLALAILGDDRLAAGLGDRVVIGRGTAQETVLGGADNQPFVAVTALAPRGDGRLLICDGSRDHGTSDWVWDLMQGGRKGRLIEYDPATGKTQVLASGLAYAFGAHEDQNGIALVSESWAHRVRRISDGPRIDAIDSLPGYPSRFSAAQDGGFWLSVFCSRTQLVEFVLKEDDYRRDMMATIDPKYWIAPAFNSGEDFLEPLQAGGVKQMGYLKPWAPPRSYGLVIRYGADLTPQYSLHSRVGGRHHGITATAQVDDTLYVLSKGAGRILKLSVSQAQATLFKGSSQ